MDDYDSLLVPDAVDFDKLMADVLVTPWSGQLDRKLMGYGESIAEHIWSFLDPSTVYLVATRDGQMVTWIGPGFYPPRQVGISRIFRMGSEHWHQGDPYDRVQCATIIGHRLVVASRKGRVVSIPLCKGTSRTHFHRLGQGVLAMEGVQEALWLCMQDGSLLWTNDTLTDCRPSATPPPPWAGNWKLAVGTAIYTACPYISAVRCWCKMGELRATFALPHVTDPAPPAADPYGVVQLRCLPAARARHDKLLVALLREIQIWDVAQHGDERSMTYVFRTPSALLQVWPGPTDHELLIMMATEPMTTTHRQAWISLLGGMDDPTKGSRVICHYNFSEDALALGHDQQVVIASPGTGLTSGGLTHHWVGLDPLDRRPQADITEAPVAILPLRVLVARRH